MKLEHWEAINSILRAGGMKGQLTGQFFIADYLKRYHCASGPALVMPNGDIHYYINGRHHRDDGPAVICSDGSIYWYKWDCLHRDDGPAHINSKGTGFWYKNGIFIRRDLPLETCKTAGP